MQANNSLPFLFGTKVTSRSPGRLEMTVVVRGVFRLAPGEAVAPIDDLAQVVLQGDVFADDDEELTGAIVHASDFADFKPKADVLLRGTCHPGGGRSAKECSARFAVGDWSKTLRVFGRRVWTDRPFDPISEPVPFQSMPIVYENAFGGPRFEGNPVGRGHEAAELPTVESVATPLRSRRDAPEPAGFGPLSPYWPRRRGKVGKDYGQSWRKTRAPFYASDFDWSHFNAAPEDQQIPYLRGDEKLEFEFVHPDTARFVTALPGLRPRVLCRRTDGYTAELTMNLDTLIADLDASRLVLLWRGLVPVSDDQLDDVRTLLVEAEPIAAPRPAEHYLSELEALDRDPMAYFRERLVPPEVRAKIEDANAVVKKAQAESAALEAKAAAARTEAPDPGADTAARVEALLEPHTGQMSEAQLASKKQLLEKLRSFVKDSQPKLEELRARAPSVTPTRDGIYGAVSEALASQKAQAAAAGIPMGRFEAAEKQLAAAKARMPGPEALGAKVPAEAAPAPSTPEQALEAMGLSTEPGPRAVMMGRDFSGRDMRGLDLRGALLRGAKLVRTNLAGALLASADLGNADLEGADLTGADLTGTNFTGARAVRAVLDEAKLDRTIFLKTDLTGASLVAVTGQMASFQETAASGLRLPRSRLHKVVFARASLDGADFTGAELEICCFLDCRAPGALFDEARMTRTAFLQSKLEKASFYRATGDGCSWHGTTVDGADFRHCRLRRAQFNKASLVGARLHAADFRGGRFDRAVLERADFTKADLMSVSFCKATLTDADFSGASLYDAKFLGAAAARGSRFEGANLTRALWEES
ncbi:MAG TPA: DUF2169 domain-containing protein [Polyangiaceae bacterium]|jgi:uncharacterized protein YjbI with pentapeptide repeats